MKNYTLLIVAALGIAVFYVWQKRPGTAAALPTSNTATGKTPNVASGLLPNTNNYTNTAKGVVDLASAGVSASKNLFGLFSAFSDKPATPITSKSAVTVPTTSTQTYVPPTETFTNNDFSGQVDSYGNPISDPSSFNFDTVDYTPDYSVN